jgi:hypothetical protein
MTRGRRSLAQKLLEELQEEEETEDIYLVSYDFIEEKPHHRFWSNFKEIIKQAGGERIQYSLYLGGRRGAKAVRGLAEAYGADVRCFVAYEFR